MPTALVLLLLASLAKVVDVVDARAVVDECHGQRLRLLPRICNLHRDGRPGGDGDGVNDASVAVFEINRAVVSGHLSKARWIAYECLSRLRDDDERNKSLGSTTSSHLATSGGCCPPTREEVVRAYKRATDAFFLGEKDFLGLISQSARDQEDGDADGHGDEMSLPPAECWDGRHDSVQTIRAEMTSDSFAGFIPSNDAGSGMIMNRGSAAIQSWNDCCSFFRPCDEGSSCSDPTNASAPPCCGLGEGSDNHLILPALREPSVSVHLEFDGGGESELVVIEQEGSLRMYDVSGVLWPAGYLLGLCLADPIACGVPEALGAVDQHLDSGRVLAVELGSGVGFASIAFAKALKRRMAMKDCTTDEVCAPPRESPLIVATDASRSSLALIASNAYGNGASDLVAAVEANHTDSGSLSFLSRRMLAPPAAATVGNISGDRIEDGGFDVVIGSSLQALFDGTSLRGAALWRSLDVLLSRENPDAVALFSHVGTGDERIRLPPSEPGGGALFECVRRVSGDRFAMKTRDGRASDFELVLLRRRRPV